MFLNILSSIICALLIGLLVLGVVEVIRRKRLVKEMNKRKPKHYIQNGYELKDDGEKYYLSYFLLKPEWYKKIKPEDFTSPGFDIDTANVQFARITLMDEKQTTTASLYVPCYKLRGEIEQEYLELIKQVKECDISTENFSILKQELKRKLKEKEVLKDY